MNRTSHIIRSSFWTFFIATVLSSAIDKVNSVVSGMIVGQSLGPDAVSVVNLAYPILNIIKIPSMFVVLGASLLAAKAVGERKYEDVRRLFTVTLVFSVGMAFAVALGVLAFGGEVAKLLTGEERLLPLLAAFIGPAAFSCVSTVAYVAFSAFAKAVGKPRLVVRGAFVDLVSNLLLTVFFVRGLGLGMNGVALSLFFAAVFGAVSMSTLFRTDSRMIGFVRPSGGWFVPSAWRSFCLGIPLQIGALLLSLVLLILNLLAQKIGGADAVFFGSIGIQMMTIAVLVLTGSSGAIVSIGGALWGEKDMRGYRILLKTVFRIVVVSQLALIALVWAFPEAIAAAFGADEVLAAKAVLPIREFVLMFLPMCMVMVLVSVYTLEGHGRAATVLQLGLFASLLAPLFLTAWFLPSAYWLSIPVGTSVLLLLTTVWSFLVSRRNRGLHAFTLAPKADAFPECGFSLKTGGMDVAAARDEVAGFLDGRFLAAPTAEDVRSDVGDLLRRIGAGERSVWCDVRAVDVDEKLSREIRVIVKVGGVRRDPSDGLHLRAGSVKYDFLNGINCVYLTYAVKRGALA